MSIKPLPGDVVAQIKSSTIITSLGSVVSGLVCNSLDAGASKINIAVDFRRGNCSVEDNGQGIPPSEFKPGGGLGKLHCTLPFGRYARRRFSCQALTSCRYIKAPAELELPWTLRHLSILSSCLVLVVHSVASLLSQLA